MGFALQTVRLTDRVHDVEAEAVHCAVADLGFWKWNGGLASLGPALAGLSSVTPDGASGAMSPRRGMRVEPRKSQIPLR